MRSHVWFALIAILTAALAVWFLPHTAADPLTAVPQFSHASGLYNQDITLTLQAPTRQAAVLLTTDGRDPSPGDLYNAPLILSGQQVISVKSRLLWPDGHLGPIITHSYFVNIATQLPLLNITTAPDNLWDETFGIYTNFAERGLQWERSATAVFYDPLTMTGWESTAGLRLHGGGSREFDKKSLRLYFRDQRLIYPLFGEIGVTEFRQVVLHSGGQDLGEFALSWTLLRDQLASELALEIGLYSPRARPVLLFLNGQPWGIYLLRERPHERFLQDTYGVQNPLILDSPDTSLANRNGAPERLLWDNLIDFAAQHNLNDDANYAYVQTQINLNNFIDYHILQLYMANTDWPGHNYQLFRPQIQTGKWQWLVWDSNYTFGLQPVLLNYEASTAATDSLTRLLTFTDPNNGGRHALLFQKLWHNPDFRRRFTGRFNELLDSTFSAELMLGRIDRLAAPLAHDIAFETGRWPHFTNWAYNVQALRHFVQQRPQILKTQLPDE